MVVVLMVVVMVLLLLVLLLVVWVVVVVLVVVVVEEELPLTRTLSPEYVSEFTALRLPWVLRRSWGMKRDVRVVSRSVIRSIFDRLCSSMLVWSSCVCCCGWAAFTAALPPLTSAKSGRLPPSKKYSYWN